MAASEQIRDLVVRFYEHAWNQWADDVVDGLLCEDFMFRGSLGDEAVGPAGFRLYRDKVRAAFPDFHNDVQEVVVEDDRAAARLHCTGRHEGELFGLKPTGRDIAYAAVAFFKARDGRLAEAWVLGDLDRLRAQLADRS